MPDKFSKETRSKIMSSIRSKNTKPELMLKPILRKLGFSYQPKIYGSPDFANKKLKIAIFIDGCFWHSCPLHGHKPKSNKKYWAPKLEKTAERDKKNKAALKSVGYKVVSFWEHDINKKLTICIKKIKALSNGN
ncbi:very short patch repair endonuclease [Candidatus Woesearchaeota archaeon]|nr:very short patch repair endonuclease [Candidatus Woesearchaeota archaeon]